MVSTKDLPPALLFPSDQSSGYRKQIIELSRLLILWQLCNPNKPFDLEEAKTLAVQKLAEFKRIQAEQDRKAQVERERVWKERYEANRKEALKRLTFYYEDDNGDWVLIESLDQKLIHTFRDSHGDITHTMKAKASKVLEELFVAFADLPDSRHNLKGFLRQLYDRYIGTVQSVLHWDGTEHYNFRIRVEWKLEA
jgi:hypothetical protein